MSGHKQRVILLSAVIREQLTLNLECPLCYSSSYFERYQIDKSHLLVRKKDAKMTLSRTMPPEHPGEFQVGSFQLKTQIKFKSNLPRRFREVALKFRYSNGCSMDICE